MKAILDASKIMNELKKTTDSHYKKIEQKLGKLSAENKKSISQSSVGPSAAGAYSKGSAAGQSVGNDLDELKSGKFAGMIESKISAASEAKDKIFGKRQDKLEKSISENNDVISKISKEGVKVLKVEKLDLPPGAFKGFGGGGGSSGGGGRGGGNGSAGGGSGPSAKGGELGEMTSQFGNNNAGSINPLVAAAGIAAAGAGIVLKGLSTISGMHQSVIQGQAGTIDAYDGQYTSNNIHSSVLSNAEFAQVGLSRAKIMGGSAADSIDNIGHRGLSGAQFGKSVGIGGVAGEETFAKLNKFGGFGESKSEFKQMLAEGVASGFSGAKQGEFFQGIASIVEESYKSGHGMVSAADTAGIVSGIHGAGVNDSRSMSIAGNLTKSFQTDGSQMKSIALAKRLQDNGGDIMEGWEYVEDPANMKKNLGAVRDLFGGDKNTENIFLRQNQAATAKELNHGDIVGNILSGKKTSSALGGSDLARSEAVGGGPMGSIIAKSNSIDTLVSGKGFEAAFELQSRMTENMVNLFEKMQGSAEGASKGLEKLMDVLGMR